MKRKIFFRLLILLSITGTILPSTVDAFSLGHLFKKVKKAAGKAAGQLKKSASPFMKKVQGLVHGPIGHMALQAGGGVIAQAAGSQAGSLFQGAATSLHLADQADADADDAEQAAQQAEDDDDQEVATQQRTTAEMYRQTARNHRANHAAQKKAYEQNHGRSFDDDYREHVAPHIEEHLRKNHPDAYDEDGGDDDGDDNSYDDE